MSPSVAGSSSQPQLTLEPCHLSKKITNISQWISAFNIIVSVYAERSHNYTLQLTKYTARWFGIWLERTEIGISHWKSYTIALLALFPIAIAVHIWGHIINN